MKLDATDLRYVTPDEFRVLSTVETLSRSHLCVPVTLIAQHLATHKSNGSVSVGASGGIQKCLGGLAKRGLVGKVMHVKYDGYRLTYGGFDFLALRAFSRRTPIPSISSVGQRVGVGKEGDVYIVKGKGKGPMMIDSEEKQSNEDGIKRARYGGDEEDEDDDEMRVLKMHRLGRISFRKIKEKRDYLGQRKSASWMYMSKLAAEKEFAFMKVLHEHGFPVPKPYDQSRHSIVMSYIDGLPLRSVTTTTTPPADLFAKLMALVVRLAQHGLIHGDFNEFNLMIREDDGEPMVIDFPQMVSVRHANAEHFFNRDVQCVRKFFRKRFRFESTEYPTWRSIKKTLPLGKFDDEDEGSEDSEQEDEDEDEDEDEEVDEDIKTFPRLDLLVEASGFNRNMQNELERYMNEVAEMSDDDSELSELSGKDNEDEIEDSDNDEEEELEGRAAKLTLDKEDSEDSDSDAGSEAPPLIPASTAGDTTFTSRTHTTSGTRASKTPRASKDDSLRNVVTSDLAKQRIRTESKHHTRKGLHGAGKAQGHKWKSSTATKVGKTTGDGW